jgi:hypothetical protein
MKTYPVVAARLNVAWGDDATVNGEPGTLLTELFAIASAATVLPIPPK